MAAMCQRRKLRTLQVGINLIAGARRGDRGLVKARPRGGVAEDREEPSAHVVDIRVLLLEREPI